MHVDDTHYPLVLQRIDLHATPSMIEDCFAKMRRIGDRAIRDDTYYASIAVPSGAFSPLQRAKLAEEIQKTSMEQLRRSLGTFVVIENGAVRGALIAVRWLANDKLGNVTPVASWSEALDLATAALRSKGIALPASLDRLRVRSVG